ncbi:efflux RND transporter periplasmic adaptor subunit [Anaeromyxobacter paludicola]|uniref:Periplasmic multidrug efflux lipoprotein n=1 Tax=Anaeromyxobacter paludicola TaxID=2918171 RepID=A0ABM7XCG8_9BACT|nr:efflux RND transporter periplasmic adaptor subunit [Anaeromyxobacter paludicola]BDG09574.1 periplasmic multidrug efflux lipoprotein [Anaeromyxobacter paludicola]
MTLRFCFSPTTLLAALAGIAVLASGCSRAAPPKAPPPAAVTVTPVVRQDVPVNVEAVATVDGYANVDIRARVRGFLERQHYDDGATVKEGQLLFTVERSEYEAALASARAALSRALAAQAHGRTQLERRTALAKVDGLSQQELEDAQAQARDADGQVEAARAQVRQAELNLSYTAIRAPIGGVAGLAQVRAGNLVGQDGPTLLTTVSQVDPVRVTFPLSEVDYVRAPDRLKKLAGRDLAWARRQFPRLDQGQPGDGGDPGVELLLSDGKPYAHRGVIVAANRQVDPTSGTIQLQALFPNPDHALRPGQYGRVRLRQEGAGGNVLVVPEKSLVQLQGTYSLAVVGPDAKVQLRQVKVGPNVGALRIVEAGVSEGERVVVDGLQAARDGATVAPKDLTATAANLPAPAAPATGRP